MRRFMLMAVVAAGGLGLAMLAVEEASAQGYFRNGARVNPITGTLEFVDFGYPFPRTAYGPWRSGFTGASFDPATGLAEGINVQRNPFTGRIQSQTIYVNPWTGQRMVSSSFYNPFTRKYETAGMFVPPQRPPEVQVNVDQTIERRAQRPGPKIIEVQPEDKTPQRGPRIIEVKPDGKRDF